MAGFKRVSGNDSGFQRFVISNLACAIGDLLVFDRSANTVVKATSSSSLEDIAGVCVEATTTADISVLAQRATVNDEFVVDTTNNTTTASNYERMVLTDEHTINNTGTDSTSDSAVFMQLSPVGAASAKQIRGRFNLIVDRA